MDDKINKIYIEKENKILKRLNKTIERITQENLKLKEGIRCKEKTLKELTDKLDKQRGHYNKCLKYIISKGLIIEVISEGANLKQWEKIDYIKEKEKIFLKDKKGNIIKVLSSEFTEIFDDVCNLGYNLSFIIIRVEHNKAIVQLRFDFDNK